MSIITTNTTITMIAMMIVLSGSPCPFRVSMLVTYSYATSWSLRWARSLFEYPAGACSCYALSALGSTTPQSLCGSAEVSGEDQDNNHENDYDDDRDDDRVEGESLASAHEHGLIPANGFYKPYEQMANSRVRSGLAKVYAAIPLRPKPAQRFS